MTNINVQVVPAPFGNSRIVAQIGDTVLSHFMLFKPDHKERAAAQAAKIQELLMVSGDPLAELDAARWENPATDQPVKRRVFKPSAAA